MGTIVTSSESFQNNDSQGSALKAGDSNLKKTNSAAVRYISSILSFMLSIILLFSGITKIIDPALLIENLSSVFPSVSETIVISISSLLPLVEIGLGVFLMVYGVKGSRGIGNKGVGSRGIGNKGIRAALISTVVLFGIFFLYSVYGFILGNQSDCGCFGNVAESTFGWGMIVRNFVFVLLAVFLFFVSKRK